MMETTTTNTPAMYPFQVSNIQSLQTKYLLLMKPESCLVGSFGHEPAPFAERENVKPKRLRSPSVPNRRGKNLLTSGELVGQLKALDKGGYARTHLDDGKA